MMTYLTKLELLMTSLDKAGAQEDFEWTNFQQLLAVSRFRKGEQCENILFTATTESSGACAKKQCASSIILSHLAVGVTLSLSLSDILKQESFMT